jgi:hypothetical protein
MKYTYDRNGNNITVTVDALVAPQIAKQPVNQISEPGQIASFSVVVSDASEVTFQWKFNGTDIPEATGDSLLLTNIGAANEGQYSVVVTNTAGSVTSLPAALMLDSDRDGLPDTWEIEKFGNLTSQRSEGDPDRDGVSNLDEFLDGTDPISNASLRPRLIAYSDAGGSVTVTPMKLNYELDEPVTLTAIPIAPNVFVGWTGDLNTGDLLSTINPATFEMNGNKTVQARFASAVPVPPGLVGWWRVEGNAQDSSTSTNHGTLRNGAYLAVGKVGQAFSLDGRDDFIEIPDAPALRPVSLTLEAWVKFDATSGLRVIFSKPVGTGISDSYALWLQDRSLRGAVGDAAGIGTVLVFTNFSPIPGRWYHLAYTFDDSTKQQVLYVDGIQVGTGTASKSAGYDTQPLLLGRDTENGVPNFFLQGRIDEAAIYNRALSPMEIASIYNAGPAGKRL